MSVLTLVDLSSAFALLGIGIGLSLFAFLLEMIVLFKVTRKNNKVRVKLKKVIVENQLYGL